MKYLLPFFLVFSIAACSAAGFSNEKIRYRITVTVETPEGIKTGSAVREAGRYTEPSILPDQGGTFYNVTRGEAVVVDLGQRGVLFALLGGEDEAKEIFNLFADAQKSSHADWLPDKHRPLRLFYFKDLNDPMTVSPARDVVKCFPHVEGCANGMRELPLLTMEKAFGPGVALKSFEVARTKQSFNDGVQNFLPWLRKIGGKYIHGQNSSRGAPYGLHGGKFKVGD